MKKSDVQNGGGSTIKPSGTSPSLSSTKISTSSRSLTGSVGGTIPKSTTAGKPPLAKSESTSTLTSKVSPSLPSTIKKTSTVSGSSTTKTTPPTLSKGLSTPNLPTSKKSPLSTSTSSTSKLSSTSTVTKPTTTTTSKTISSRVTTTTSKTTASATPTPLKTVSSKKPPAIRPTTTSRTLGGTLSSQPTTRTTNTKSQPQSATSIKPTPITRSTSASTLRKQLEQQESQPKSIPYEEFDPNTSPEFENVAKEFILLEDDDDDDEDDNNEQLNGEEYIEEEILEEEEFDNVIDLDSNEEILEEEVEEEEVQEILLSSSSQTFTEVISLDDDEGISYDTDDTIPNTLKNTQALYNDQPQVPDTTVPMDIPGSDIQPETKPIEIKKSSSWMSSFFTKISKSTTSMISTSLSSTPLSTSSSTSISTSSLILSTENLDPNTSNQISPTLTNSDQISPPLPSNLSDSNSNISQNKEPQLKTLPPPNMMYQMNTYNTSHQNLNMYTNNNPNNHYANQSHRPHHPNHHPQHSHHPNHHSQHIQHHQNNNNNNNNTNNRYSQSFQYKMQPHNQPGGLSLLPFTINSYRAISIFQDWYKSLWFAPTDFKEKIEPTLKIYKYFVPYYVFSCVVHSVHSGKVGFLKQDDPSQQPIIVSQDEQKKKLREEEEIDWMNGSTHPYTQSHNDTLVYSPVMLSVDSDPPIYLHSKEINDWRIDSTEPFHSQHPQLIYPNYVVDPQSSNLLQYNNQPINNPNNPSNLNGYNEVENTQLSQLPLVINKLDWNQAWVFAENKIKKNEIYGNDTKLKRDYQAHMVKDVETETKFENISYRTIYAPIYKIQYKYDGKDYSFVINGQTGKRYSQNRPFGVGSIKNKAIKILTGGVFSSEKTKSLEMDRKINNNGMVKGLDLNEIDQAFGEEGEQIKLYQDDHYYLLLPSSDQFLILKTTGYIIIRNSGKSEPIKIQSHKRMTDEIGGSCILEPNEIQTFAYKGSWCIQVLEGDHDSLELIKVETNSGSDKSFGDLLMQ